MNLIVLKDRMVMSHNHEDMVDYEYVYTFQYCVTPEMWDGNVHHHPELTEWNIAYKEE